MHRARLKRLLCLLLCVSAGAVAVAQQDREPAERRPDLLVFLVDDLGWQDLSLALGPEQTPFNRRYRTPNVERLAREGLRFTTAYASAPVCSPTRTSLMTGMSPARTGITYWTLHQGQDTSAAHPRLKAPAWNLDSLQPTDVTLPRLLRDAGYHTIHAGKAHFGAQGTPGEDPRALGFEVNIAGHAAGGPGSYYGKDSFRAKGSSADKPSVWDVPGLEAYHGQDIYLTEAIALEVQQQLEQSARDGAPIYLYFAPYAVHAPLMVNARYAEHYPELEGPELAYATMIETVDAALGATLETLERLGRLDNTLVVFASDNGGLSAHGRGGEPNTHNAPLRSGKGSAYEGGVRVPLVVRWPGVVAAGTVTHAPVITEDLFPTLLASAGVAIPAQHAAGVEGLDLLPLLRGAEPDLERALHWHMPHFWGVKGPGIEPFSALRRGSWKLYYFHDGPRFELYDLEQDLSETRDLSLERPLIVESQAEALSTWLEATGARLSIDMRSGVPVPLPRAAVGLAQRRQPSAPKARGPR